MIQRRRSIGEERRGEVTQKAKAEELELFSVYVCICCLYVSRVFGFGGEADGSLNWLG